MAVTKIDSAVNKQDSSNTTINVTIDTVGASHIIVFGYVASTSATLSCSDSESNSYTGETPLVGSFITKAQCFIAPVTSENGSTVVTLTSNSAQFLGIAAYSADLDGSTPYYSLEQADGGFPASSPVSVNQTPTDTTDRLLTCFFGYGANGETQGTGQVIQNSILTGTVTVILTTEDTGSTSTDTQTFTYSSASGATIQSIILKEAVGDVIDPTLVSAEVTNTDKNKIVITVDENLDETSIPSTSDFTPSGSKTVTNVDITDDTITLTVDSDYAFGDTITITYVEGINPIQDLAGNPLGDFTSYSVTNNIANPASPDILVERFEKDVPAAGTTHTLTNDVGDITKAIIRMTVSGRASAGDINDNSSNMSANEGGCAVYFSDTDELTFERTSSATDTIKVFIEVWRYVGDPGGDNEFIVRWQGIPETGGSGLTHVNGATSLSTAISGIVDKNKCVPFNCGQYTNYNRNTDFPKLLHGLYINSSDELVVTRGPAMDVSNSVVSVQVVEFTGSNWSIGFGKETGVFDTTNPVVTLKQDYDFTGSDFTADYTKGFIEANYEGDGNNTGLEDVAVFFNDPGTGTGTTLTVGNSSGSQANAGDLYIYWIQNDDLIVTRGQEIDRAIPEGYDTGLTFPSITLTDLEKAGLEIYTSTNGGGDAHMRGRIGGILTDLSEITCYVHRSGNNGDYLYGIIKLDNLTSGVTPTPTRRIFLIT